MSPREGERQRRILYAAAFLRALAIGLMAVLIALYSARVGMSAARIGVILSSALWGAALATVITLWIGPRISERALLVGLCVVPAVGCALFLVADSFALLAATAFLAMFNVNGRDRGAIPIVEQAIFPATTSDASRTKVFAWYNVLLDAGYATGGLLATLPALLAATFALGTAASMRAALWLFCGLYLATAALYSRMPARSAGAAVGLKQLSPESRPIVAKIGALFLLDAFGGGFVGSALLAYFFAERFDVPAAELALLFTAGRVLSAFSHLAAAWLARRIGLVNTMIYTHVPSSLLLFTIVASGDFTLAACLFLLREGLNEMDVPTRQSYVMAVVKPEERLAAAGATSLARCVGWASAPMLAGVLMQWGGLGVPLVVAGVTKLAYDVFLWREFRRVKPPEELASA
ncbi:MAG TPA: MFS transporter [Usitatibacter sp.]|jgi:predicted MFS family arabinose efflux permease|nr:MFS transporter [Usitatibacter sp.]